MDRFKKNVNTSYYSVASGPVDEDEQPLRPQQFELGDHPQLVKPRRWLVTIVVQLICALWLVPIVALLYVNLAGHVIGPSAWCLGRDCRVDTFNPNNAIPEKNIARFNRNDHNLLGGLQLVAKALEIWFIGIAAALVYLITMRLSAKPEGLPVGYLTRPTEFSEFLNLLDPLLWTTGPSPFSVHDREKRVGRRAWFLVIFTVFLCILCNLMGPAVAVLVIPSLQWINTEHVGNLRFGEMNAGAPPGNNENSWFTTVAAYLCTPEELSSKNYSCTFDGVGHSMDAWFDSYLSSHGNIGYTQAFDLTFQVNKTANYSSVDATQQNSTDYIYWVPSRQTLADLTIDQNVVALISQGWNLSSIRASESKWFQPLKDPLETFVEYNKSLGLNLERPGPITGFIPTMWFGQNNSVNQTLPTTINVDKDRSIRCYTGYIPGWTPMENSIANMLLFGWYTKCIRIGRGWSQLNKAASFYVPYVYDATSGTSKKEQAESLGVEVTIYSSDRAVFFLNGTLPLWLPAACLTAGDLANPNECDFDRLFTEPAPPLVADRVMNVNTIEMYMANGVNNSVMLASDFVAFTNFTTYSLDVSPLTNSLGFVRLYDLPTGQLSSTQSIHVDPDWILAGWSVAEGGNVQIGRTSGTALLELMYSFFDDGFDAGWDLDEAWNHFTLIDYVSFLPVAHSLSLIDYNTAQVSSGAQPDEDHPLLYRTSRMYVWGYFMASRTAIMGVVVAISGCFIVLVQLYMGFKDRRRYRSPTQVLVAALEHVPKGEFEGKRHNERAMARVPFHIEEHPTHALRFSSLSGQGGSSPKYSRVPSGISGHSRLSSAHTLVSQGHGQGQSKNQGQGQGLSPGAFSPPNVQSQGYFQDWTAYSPWQGQGGFQPWQGGGPGVAAGPTFPRSFT